MTTIADTTRKARGRGPLSVTAQQAKVAYLALENARSLRHLRQWYEESGIEFAPSFAILAVWSKRHGWQCAAAEYDESVGAALLLRLHETSVQRAFDKVAALNTLAQRCLDTAAETAVNVTAATVSDLRALVSTAIDAIKTVEILTGGVGNRREDYAGGIDPAALAMLAEIETKVKARLPALLPPEAQGTTTRE
jgi:hypothetical protein